VTALYDVRIEVDGELRDFFGVEVVESPDRARGPVVLRKDGEIVLSLKDDEYGRFAFHGSSSTQSLDEFWKESCTILTRMARERTAITKAGAGRK